MRGEDWTSFPRLYTKREDTSIPVYEVGAEHYIPFRQLIEAPKLIIKYFFYLLSLNMNNYVNLSSLGLHVASLFLLAVIRSQ